MHAESEQAFLAAQSAVLESFGLDAESRYIEVSSPQGRAHALTLGQGPPVVMLNGIGTPRSCGRH
jgi:hypothetical protein